MRPDMFEVIIERPRSGSRRARYPRARMRRLTGDARCESMGRIYGEKYLNENLAPLRRYLVAQVGRPWWKVRSEISERLDVGSAVQKHVMEHLADFVDENVFEEEGEIWTREWGGKRVRVRSIGRPKIYVDPRSGILRMAPMEPRKAKKRARRRLSHVRRLGANRELRRMNGTWYLCTIGTFDRLTQNRPLDALVRRAANPWAWHEEIVGDLWTANRYVQTARILTKREREKLLG
jgi:hypothetical protein